MTVFQQTDAEMCDYDDDDNDNKEYTSAEHNFFFQIISFDIKFIPLLTVNCIPNNEPAVSPFTTQVCTDTI